MWLPLWPRIVHFVVSWPQVALIPTVLVVSTFEKDYIKWATAGLSLLLAIGTSALKAFKFQENWMNFRQMAETLKQEKYFYEAELGPYANAPDKRATFVDRVESLISRENAIWINVHQQREESASNAGKH
ncbi:MAG TPA: DUF4231 domain-containing protein [Blastocatellia bacterium]|jgi:hypothetical protein